LYVLFRSRLRVGSTLSGESRGGLSVC
jgi:hypothetical protein